MQHTTACDDCLVSVVFQVADGAVDSATPSAQPMELDAAEASAIHALAEAGLVPRLRLVPWEAGGTSPEDDSRSPGAPGLSSWSA